MTRTTHTVLTEDHTLRLTAEAVLRGDNVLLHGGPGKGCTRFLKTFEQTAPSFNPVFRHKRIAYHRAIDAAQRHQPLSQDAYKAHLLLLDDFACGFDREGPFKTHGIPMIACTGTPYSEVALEAWHKHLCRPAPDLIIKIMAHGSYIATREAAHV